MSKFNFKILFWFASILLIGTWLIMLVFTKNISASVLSEDALTKIPKAISINVLFWWVFARWLWSNKLFYGWLVLSPNLSGKWKGQIESSFKPDGQDKTLPPLQATMTIHQSFFNTSVCVKTDEMESQSFSSTWLYDPDTKAKKLCYSYTSTPEINIRDRSPMHEGTAVLEATNEGAPMLKGHYWTGRRTTGMMKFEKC